MTENIPTVNYLPIDPCPTVTIYEYGQPTSGQSSSSMLILLLIALGYLMSRNNKKTK